MIKNRLTFSIIVVISILSIFFLRKDILLVTGETDFHTSLLKIEIEEVKFTPMKMRYTEMEQKIVRQKYTSDEFQAGMNVLIYGHPNIIEVKKSFHHLQKLGINSVAINFPFYQTDWQANEVHVNQINSPTVTELQEVIAEAHNAGLTVTLRPIMDEQSLMQSNKWRGQIRPTNPEKWFDSYEALLLTYAELAEHTAVKVINIGTELNSMQNNYEDRWTELIENIRYVYKGELMYSFNWDVVDDIRSNNFIELLDHVGIDAYFPLEVADDASVQMLEEAWEEQINEFKNILNHPSIVVTEAGIIPVTGAYRTPYSWTIGDGELDWEAQANYYEATFTIWKPVVEGIYWWNITIGEESEEISYSPLYSPTEKVISEQLSEFHND